MTIRSRVAAAALALGAILAIGAGDANASSHREAPFITKNPKVDGTDFYMFMSYETGRTNFVTLIANYQPLQDAYGGPNYFAMDPEALYEIHIDNNGNGEEDITFQFRFRQELANSGTGITVPVGDAGVPIPLVVGGLVNGTDPNLGAGSVNNINVRETYTVNVVRGNRRTGTSQPVANASGGATTFTKPLDYIGQKTFRGGYDAYANAFKYNITIPGCATAGSKMFVGQRREGFAVNIGTIFDLVNADLATIADAANRNAIPNPIANKNVTSIALEIPADCLRTGASGQSAIIGGWQTASVRQARVINPSATYTRPAREGGAWVQVSRLGMPLVNEVVIGLKDKDRFNSSEPKGDAQFLQYVTHPTLAKLLELIYGAANAPAPTAIPRNDLVAGFLTGVPGVNANGATAEYLRLNTSLPPVAAGSRDNLGAINCFTAPTDNSAPALIADLSQCDTSGFPNGRRPGDDIVDIALRLMMGRLLPLNVAGAGRVPLHDAVLQDHSQFDATFPYLRSPTGGT